jgi:DNA-binding response OmpR family regulator
MTRILVAEDDPDLALGLRNNLEIEGYDVRVARDGAEALALALQWQPAVLVLDLVMPKIDGMRVLRELRERHSRQGARVEARRGRLRDEAVRTSGAAGASRVAATARAGRAHS